MRWQNIILPPGTAIHVHEAAKAFLTTWRGQSKVKLYLILILLILVSSQSYLRLLSMMMTSFNMSLRVLAVAWVLVSFGPGRVFADCDLRNIETKYYHNQWGILRTNQARCCCDAKAGAIKKFEDNVNLVKRYSSSAKSDAQKISASYNPVTKTGS